MSERVRTAAIWLLLLAATTAVLWASRSVLDKAHAALAYLLLVLGASSRHGRGLGLTLAVLAFLSFNFFLISPYYTFTIHDPADWLVLVAFLTTGVIAAELLNRARREAEVAEQRAHDARALRETDRLKDALLASVSHDLRTPLTTIKALVQEIRLEGDDRAAIVEEEVDRLDRFVADLLDLSRLNGGALRLDLELNAADDLVGSALRQTAGVTASREVHVNLAGPEPLIGRFDFSHSLRALGNLIENACKYSPVDSPLHLRAYSEGAFLIFEVADRGPGVKPDEQDRIFEPFVRSPASSGVGGTGLGLSIARRLAEAQGGEVRFAPRRGGGSVFSLILPAASLDGLT